MPAPVLQFKRGNAGVAGTVPALRPGEPAISLNNFDFFIGIDTSVANNKFFGSHRYWGREDGTNSLRLKLVDKNGTNSINLKAPDTLVGSATYTFPAGPVDGYFLKTNSAGILSWEQVVSDFNIAADSGPVDNVSTGSTITFAGGTNINTVVGNNIITINLDDNLNVSGIGTFGSLVSNDGVTINGTLQVGTGVGITQFSNSVSTGNSTSSVPTSSAVANYVSSQLGNVDLTLGINADTGGPSTVNTSQTLTISGTPNEVETSVSAQTITIGLPDDVVVGTSLSTPTIRTGIIKSSNTGATALTVTASDVIVANDLTVNGNLYIEGSTTQVNTTSLTVEDRTIELGKLAGSLTQPATTTWDLAVLFNYGDGAAKKAGLVWEASGATKRFQFTTDINPGSDGSDSQTNLPQFSVTNFAPIEISELWVNNSCTGGAQQVIGCVGSELQLQNITIDAGSF